MDGYIDNPKLFFKLTDTVIIRKLYFTFYPAITKEKTYSFIISNISFFEKNEKTSNRTQLDNFIKKMIKNYKDDDNEKKLLNFFFEFANRSKLFLINLYIFSCCLEKQKLIEWNEIKERCIKMVKELKHIENEIFYNQIIYPRCEENMEFHIDKAKCSAYIIYTYIYRGIKIIDDYKIISNKTSVKYNYAMIDVPLIDNGVYRFDIRINHYSKDDNIYFGLSASQIFLCDTIESCDNVYIINGKTGETRLNKTKGNIKIEQLNENDTVTLLYNRYTQCMMFGKSIDKMFSIFNRLPSTLFYPILFFDGNTEVSIVSCGYCNEISNLMINNYLQDVNIVTPTKVDILFLLYFYHR